MGIEELDKGKWYQRVAEDYWNKAKWVGGKAKDLYEWDKEWREKKGPGMTTTPYLWNMLDWAGFVGTDAPAFDVDKAGTGKKDSVLGVDVPNMWKSYDTEKIAKEKGIELTPFADTVLRSDELIKDTVRWPLNAVQSGLEFVKDVPHFTKTAAQEGWKYLDEKLNPFDINKDRNISSPQGTGAWWTQMQDMIGTNPIAKAVSFGSVVPTDMKKDSEKFLESAYPPLDADGYFDTDLGNWPEYQTFKSGMGWDNADQRRIDKRVEATMKNKPIPPDEILQDFYKVARENMDTVLGQNGVTGAELVASPEAVNYYFKQYFDARKEAARNNLSNEYEFQKTGQKFADWMSTNYRNELIGDYGMYPLFEEYNDQLEVLTADISPFGESAPANLSLANKDYIDALKAGKEDIGEPLEWSYGAYDRSPGYGIPEEHKKWFEYGTKEAEKLFESNQAVAAEFAALYFARAPLALRKPIQNWLQTTKTGRAIRELMPGLFQHGSRANFGIRKMATMYDTGKRSWWRTGVNAATGTIDFIRPKGGQFLGAIALGEMGSNWDRN